MDEEHQAAWPEELGTLCVLRREGVHLCVGDRLQPQGPASAAAQQALLRLVEAAVAPGLLSVHRTYEPEAALSARCYTEMELALPPLLAPYQSLLPSHLRKVDRACRAPVALDTFPSTFAGAAAWLLGHYVTTAKQDWVPYTVAQAYGLAPKGEPDLMLTAAYRFPAAMALFLGAAYAPTAIHPAAADGLAYMAGPGRGSEPDFLPTCVAWLDTHPVVGSRLIWRIVVLILFVR